MGWGWGGADGQCIKLMGQSFFVTLTWSKYFVNHLWPEGGDVNNFNCQRDCQVGKGRGGCLSFD